MIGEHDEVDAVVPGRLDDLQDRCPPVMGVVGMEVDDAGIVVELQDEGVTLFLEPRFQNFFPDEHVDLPLRPTAGSAGTGPVFLSRPAILRSGHSPQRGSVRQ